MRRQGLSAAPARAECCAGNGIANQFVYNRKLQTNSRLNTTHLATSTIPCNRMAPPKFNKGEAVSSRMAIETKAISTTSANPKYKPRRPATDPEQIQELWSEVRKQKREDMPPTTRASKKRKVNDTKAISSSETSSVVDYTAPTSTSQGITIKNPKFNELCLIPRGISIDPKTRSIGHPCSHFHTNKPSSYAGLAELKKSTLWLDTEPTFLEKVNKEYYFMHHYHLCEAEFASFAKENLLKREPRQEIQHNAEDSDQRFPRAERMLEFVCKPDDDPESLWRVPPLVVSQDYPTYTFDIRPDCSYWISLHAFNSKYSGQMGGFVHVSQERMTCPYFTVEFKRDDTAARRGSVQAATFGALALYNRYLLRTQVTSKEWTHEQECQLRHYALTIAKSSYTFWCIRPKLKDGVWKGCHMERMCFGHLGKIQGVTDFVSWTNEIHRWGLTKHLKSCETDVRLLADEQDFETSLCDPADEQECTCGDSPDAAGTSEQETLHSARALARTEAAHSKPLALLACTDVDGSKTQGPALDNGAALADPAKTAAEVCILGSSRLKSNVDLD